MAGDDGKALALLAGDPEQQFAGRLRRPAEPVHDVDGKAVGIGLGLARMRRRHQRARAEDQRAGAGDVAEQQSDQERRAAVADQPAHAVAMLEMAEFMGQHARDLVGVLGLRQQAVEQIDLAARQREGIGDRTRQHARLHRGVEAGGFADRGDELDEGPLSGRVVAGLGIEHRLDLAVGGVAEPPFERVGHQRRKAVGDQRQSEQYHANDRNRGRERPADDDGDAAAAGRVFIQPGAARDQLARQRNALHQFRRAEKFA